MILKPGIVNPNLLDFHH